MGCKQAAVSLNVVSDLIRGRGWLERGKVGICDWMGPKPRKQPEGGKKRADEW